MTGCSLQPAEAEDLASTDSAGSCYQLTGTLDFDSVPAMLPQLQDLLTAARAKTLVLDFKGIDSANSAAVALLIECRALARADNTQLELVNLPSSILKIAEVCEVSEFLG